MTSRRSRNKEQTRQEILAAARRLFSQKGLHGTSVRDIEAESGIAKGLIMHHFETKEKLYNAVQDELMREYTDFLAHDRPGIANLKEASASVVRSSYLYTRDHEDFQRIMLWSYLEGRETGREQEETFTAALVNVMRAGQKTGQVREDIDALVMPFIIKGSIDFWIRKKALIQEVAGAGVDPAAIEDCFLDALSRLFLK